MEEIEGKENPMGKLENAGVFFSSTLSYLGRSQDDRSPRILVLVR